MSVPFSETTDDLVPALIRRGPPGAFHGGGVKPGDTVVAYCHIGQQATAVIFAARTLGIKALLYDGSRSGLDEEPSRPRREPGRIRAEAAAFNPLVNSRLVRRVFVVAGWVLAGEQPAELQAKGSDRSTRSCVRAQPCPGRPVQCTSPRRSPATPCGCSRRVGGRTS